MRDLVVVIGDDLAGLRIKHTLGYEAAVHAAGHGLTGDIIRFTDPDTIVRTTVMLIDDDVLGNIHETPGQITSVRGAERSICEAFARAVRGDEVFLRRKAFTEVGTDRHWDDASGRISHQTAHARELRNGGETTFRRTRS